MKAKIILSFAITISSLGSASALARSEQNSNVVVRSRASVPVMMGAQKTREASGSQPIDVVNAPNSSIIIDSSAFVIPAVSNVPLSFGSLSIGSLVDNNLDVCGPANNERCNTAIIRVYTTGAGPGIYNALASYGMPLTFNTSFADDLVGFGVENATALATLAINPARHTINISDFGTIAKFNFNSDFTDAGAGAYSTTIVIEYVLSL